MNLIDIAKFDANGLVPAIAQDATTNEVLMLAYMNRETLQESLTKGVMVYFSRSRQKRWFKGESSGHVQTIKRVAVDCDGDTFLFWVEQAGAACHEGYKNCFFRERKGDVWEINQPKIAFNE